MKKYVSILIFALLAGFGTLQAKEIKGKTKIHPLGLNSQDKELLNAIQRGSFKDVKRALNAGASPNASNSRGTALHIAALKDSGRIATLLIDAGAKIEAENVKRDRPLHLAGPEVTLLLLQKGAIPNSKNVDRYTPRDLARGKRDSRKIIKYLLKYGR